MYQASYKTEIITKSQLVNSENCNSISFENIGSDQATVDNDIPLRYDGGERSFTNELGVIIRNQFMVKFENNSDNKKVLIIKRFYHELPESTHKTIKSGRFNKCGQ